MSNNGIHINNINYVPESLLQIQQLCTRIAVLNSIHLLGMLVFTGTHNDMSQRCLVKLHNQRVRDPRQPWSTVQAPTCNYNNKYRSDT